MGSLSASPFLIAADLIDPQEDTRTDPLTVDRLECKADPAVLMERHIEIEDPDGAVVPFELWDFQSDVVTSLLAERAVIVLKARRLGLSWVVLAYALWLAIFRQGIRILILCKTGDDAAELLDRIRRMKERLEENAPHLFAHVRPGSKNRDAVTTLDIGASTIRALMGTPAAARSETAGLVILDEFAFQRGAGAIWTAIYPTIEGGGQVAIVSTGNGSAQGAGIGAEFAKLWSKAKRGVSELVPLFFPWMARPGRDEAWKQRTIGALGDETRFQIEYPETEDQAFQVADADLIYPGPHLDAAERLGAELDALPANQRLRGDLYLGIDWGVNTHMLLARRLPSGGLYVLREVFSTNADIEQDVRSLCDVLDELGENPAFLRYDPGAAGAKVVGSFITQMKQQRPGFRPKAMKISFSKFKVVSIRYVKLLLRRAHTGEQLRVAAISPAGCPELLRQMRKAEWKDPDEAKTMKGDDHGADALLTLAAEPGYAMYKNDPNTDQEG